jgi:hypothetical protein
MKRPWPVLGTGVLSAWVVLIPGMNVGGEPRSASPPIDATTLRRKVLCGYQGWFRCPGDPAHEGWKHWSRDAQKITPESLTFEMWPDMTEATPDEKYPAPGFTLPDGGQAHLFSSAHPRTVRRHFEWMERYGLDGVFLQRFLVNVGNPSFERVLDHVRDSAKATGRVYAICYDMTGFPSEQIVDRLTDDWKRLVDELKVTRDDRYLHHDGRPVVFVWGFYPDRFGPALAHRIIDVFKADGPYRATLIGGVPWYWRREQDPEWGRAFRRFDIISPWNVGNYTTRDGQRQAATGSWPDDLAEARRAGMAYLPVIYPGFGWTHLMGPKSADQTIPRLGGAFFWRQFVTAAELGIDMAYVAMFDEVDEGTAILKVSNSPPTQARFQTFEGLPSDWYLRLAGEGTQLVREGRRGQDALPIRP